MRPRWIWIIALLQMLVVLMLISAATSTAEAQPEAAIPDVQPVQIVTIQYVPAEPIQNAPRPIPEIYEYNIGQDIVEKYARAFWGLNTTREKFAFAGIAIHRAMCTETLADGSYRFKSDSSRRMSGVITSSEFAFYRDDAPASKANIELAKLYINIHLTMILTKQYTGYCFPSWALYMDWTENGSCAVYDKIGGNEFIVK